MSGPFPPPPPYAFGPPFSEPAEPAELTGDPIYPYPDPTPPPHPVGASPTAAVPPPPSPPSAWPASGPWPSSPRQHPRPTRLVWAGIAVLAVVLLILATAGSGGSSSPDVPAGQTPVGLGPVVVPPSVASLSPGAGAAPGASTGAHTLRMPAAVDGYVRLPNVPVANISQLLVGPLTQFGGTSAPTALANATIAAYGPPAGTAKMIFIGLSLSELPDFQQLIARESGEDALSDLMGVLGSGTAGGSGAPSSFPAGRIVGSLQCVDANQPGVAGAGCGWLDDTFLALTVIADPGTLGSAAGLTRDLRNAAER